MHQAHPEGGEVAGDETGENVQRSATVLGAVGDFPDVPRIGADEYFGELRNERASDGAATDDHRKHPPQVRTRSAGGILKSPSSTLLATNVIADRDQRK